jgi:hypothetical protein
MIQKIEQIHDSVLKLKSYVYFGEVDEGVWFDAAGQSFILKGKGLYRAVERLILLMDSGNTFDTLVTNLPDTMKALFLKLVDLLREHGMLLVEEPDEAAELMDRWHTVPDEFRRFLADHLEHDRLRDALKLWRQVDVAVVGNGYALKAAAKALAASHDGTMSLFLTGASTVGVEELREAVRASQNAGLTVKFAEGALDVDALGRAALIAYAADTFEPAVARACANVASAGDVTVVIGSVFGGHACVLPAIGEGCEGGEHIDFWLNPDVPAEADHSPASLSVMGCVVAQRALDHYFGINIEAQRGKVAVITPFLEVNQNFLVPMLKAEGENTGTPAVPFVHQSRFQLPEARKLERYEQLKMALDPWFDPLFGCLALEYSDGVREIPLFQQLVSVRLPYEQQKRTVIGWGLDVGQAGIRVLTSTVAILAQSVTETECTVVVDDDKEAAQRGAYVHAVLASADFQREHATIEIPLDDITEPTAKMLLRLLRYLVPSEVRAQLQFWAEAGVGAVTISLGQEPICTAADRDLFAALSEALGRACSHCQLSSSAHAAYWRKSIPAVARSISGRGRLDWRDAIAIAQQGHVLPARLHRLDNLGLPTSIHCYYAEFV